MVGTTILVATAPLQIQLAQHTFIDAYFSFWAIATFWLTWENLQHPRHWGWLSVYTFCLIVLVLTKESAAFVVAAIIGIFVLNSVLRIGTVTSHLVAATFIGPALAMLFLAAMMGGIGECVRFYEMCVARNRTNVYAFIAQDGPWYRYLVDFVLMSPVIVALALGRTFNLRKTEQPELMMTAFLGLSFLFMANVTYGMSLRFAAYWDIPLAWLACSQILRLTGQFPKVPPAIISGVLFLIVAACNLQQYNRFFVQGALYDPITAELVKAANLLKY
jgi:4-amino-4-deoxy-L-arabinose transferase-like glycosyltransferase